MNQITHSIYFSAFPIQLGKRWKGRVISQRCFPDLGVGSNGSMIIYEVQRNEKLKSFAKVSGKDVF